MQFESLINDSYEQVLFSESKHTLFRLFSDSFLMCLVHYKDPLTGKSKKRNAGKMEMQTKKFESQATLYVFDSLKRISSFSHVGIELYCLIH